MITPAAAKGRKLFSFAAVCLAASLLLVSSAEASRDLPASLSPALERPVSIPPAPSADASFELLTDGDRILFTALSSLQESELAQVLDRRRFRPLSATVSQKLASGVSTRPAPSISLGSSDLRWKLHQGDYFLEPDPLGPVDSPNLYQAFGFDGLNVTDPWGMCSGPGDEGCGENQGSIFFRAYQWVSSAIGYTNQFVPGLITEAENIGTGVGEFGVATVMDPTVPGRVLDEMVRDTLVTSVRIIATDPDVLLAEATNESIDILSDPEKASAATLHAGLLAAGGLGGRAAISTRTVRRFANAADDLGDLARLPRVQAAVPGRGGVQPVRVGQAGEAVSSHLTGLPKNTTRIPSASGRREYRIPDHLDDLQRYIAETKNVNKQYLSSQLLDDIAYVLREGRPGRVDLIIDVRTEITLPLLREHLNLGSPIRIRAEKLKKR